MEIKSKHGIIKVFTDNVDEQAVLQIIKMGNSNLGENAHIRIMPDCHAGKGCTIGTTMRITDKICPNLIGVDIGCGVNLIKIKENLNGRLDELNGIIRKHIPSGQEVHKSTKKYDFSKLKCWSSLDKKTKQRSQYSLGSLGSGNHFIEAYDNAISIHSGSRNIGSMVAAYYQKMAEQNIKERNKESRNENNKTAIDIENDLSYLTGTNMQDYLHDMQIMQKFAVKNRLHMLKVITYGMNLTIEKEITSTHNFIDTKSMILRKGAISAQKDEILVIPLNMRDGILICKGKGNEDWNFSSPHGAGRLYSRTKAKELFSLKEYMETMKGIYSTCIGKDTIDEAPFVYKNYEEIMQNIEPTVEILQRLIPIFNFKG